MSPVSRHARHMRPSGARVGTLPPDGARPDVDALLRLANVAIVVLSSLMHLWLSLTLPSNLTLHDVGDVAYIASNHLCHGHYGYIQYLLEHRALPDFDPRVMWCYYNPPLFHVTVAVLIAAWMALTGATFVQSLWIATLVSAVCVCGIVVAARRLLERLGALAEPRLGTRVDRALGLAGTVALALVAFHPTMSWLSFTGNNDAMATMLMLVAMERAIAWRQLVERDRAESGLLVIVECALALGFGMATKVSASLVAPGIAVVFLTWLWHERSSGAWRCLVVPFLCFLAVSVSIGVAYPLHNLVRWGIPMSYVQYDATAAAVSADATPWDRLGLPDAGEFVSLHLDNEDTSREANVWAQTLKSSLFDEYYVPETDRTGSAVRLLLVLGGILAVACLALGAYETLAGHLLPGWLRAALAASVAAILVFYVRFCLLYPAVCTENFRYVVAAFVLQATLAAAGALELTRPRGSASLVRRALAVAPVAMVAVFSLDAAWLYLTHLLA